MKLKVIAFNGQFDAHNCVDEDGNKHLVDIMVDGSLENKDREYWVGKTIECDWLIPYLELAHNVKESHVKPC